LAAIEAHAWAPLIVATVGVLVAFGALIRTGLQVDPTVSAGSSVVHPPASRRATMALSVSSASIALTLAALTSVIPWTGIGKILATIAGEIH
jgi:hypothetical protein